MKRRLIWSAVLFWAMMGAINFHCLAQEKQVLDRIVAVVDDDIILLSELQQQAYKLAFEFKVDVQRDPEKFNELMKQVLDNLIIQKILFVKAKEDTIVADDNHVESEIESRINYFTRELGSPEKVEEYFGSPISKIKRTLREEIRQGLMAQQVRDQKIRDIKISRREVLELYRSMGDSLPTIKEQVHIANLMVKVKPGEEARQVALRRITAIQKTLQDSADFKELASQVSDDPGSAAAGGELGFFNRGQLVKEFEEVAFGLKPGETSDIVESPFGFHIIQPIERRGEKINCRHILVSLVPTEEDEKQTVELIKQIYDKIASDSVSFETMVEKYSDDIESKDKAGDLGWFPEDDLQIKEFQTALKDLKPGEISYPFKTKYGYHILKLLDRQQPRELSLDEDWEQIERWALNLKQQKEFLAWVEELKEDIYIRVDKIDD